MTDEEAQIRRGASELDDDDPLVVLIGVIDELRAEIARLTAPPGAAAMTALVRVIEQVEHESRTSTIEETIRIVRDYREKVKSGDAYTAALYLEEAIRALAEEPEDK